MNLNIKLAIFSTLSLVANHLYQTKLQHNPIIRPIYLFLLKSFKPDYVVVNGIKMKLDEYDGLRLTIKEFEPFETTLFKKLVNKGDVVIDIGSHIGYYTLLGAKLVGTGGKVYSFEPNPQRFEILKENVKLNKFKNIICSQKAISDSNGKKIMPILLDNNQIDVETTSLDNFLKNKKVDVIKMDIDGSEVDALLGMQKILKSNTKIKLIIEFWPAGLNYFHSSPQIYLQLLEKMGFNINEIDEESNSIKPINKKELIKKYTLKNSNHTNLICYKKSLPI